MRLLCLALILVVGPLTADDGALPDFLPPNTKVMIGVRLQAITTSKLFQGVASEAMSAGSDWIKVASLMGFDPLHDIDEILIASTAERQNSPAILVVRGRFNVEKLAAGAKRYHGVALISGGTTAQSTTALLDASTAIAGDPASVRAAIDRRGSGGAIPTALAERVALLRSRYDIWGTGQVPEGFAPNGAKAPGLDSVDRFQFGLLLSHGLEASAELHARSAQDLEKLAATLQFLKAAMANQPNQAPVNVKLETRIEANTLKLSLAIPEEELLKAVRARAMAARPAGGPVTVTGTPVPAGPARTQVNANGDTVVLTLPGKH